MAASDANSMVVNLRGLMLRNPVIVAAGTAGVLDELKGVAKLDRVGGVVTKSITREPREGNAGWRILESRVGMLNAIGLANPGIEAFEETWLPRAASVPTTVIGSAAGFSVDEYVMLAGTMNEWAERGVPAIELNVSCPNVRTGTEFGASPALLAELMRAVRPVVTKAKLWVKLSPACVEIVEAARAAVEGGADALTISNTMPAMEIDVETRRPRLGNVTGGLSGPAIHPVVTRLIHLVYRSVACDAGVPLIGAGGVSTWRDAAEFILAGASAVEMGSMMFADPRAAAKAARGLAQWVKRQGAGSVMDLVGKVEA